VASSRTTCCAMRVELDLVHVAFSIYVCGDARPLPAIMSMADCELSKFDVKSAPREQGNLTKTLILPKSYPRVPRLGRVRAAQTGQACATRGGRGNLTVTSPKRTIEQGLTYCTVCVKPLRGGTADERFARYGRLEPWASFCVTVALLIDHRFI
jgi:hypothetical protein